MITIADLGAICPTTRAVQLALFVEPLNRCMAEFEINTPEREAMFLSQVAHESGGFNYTEEIASGQAYEKRRDLGNTQFGDGPLFKGHGLIQLTGRANHQQYAAYKGMTVNEVLAYLKTPEGAANVAGWFWSEHGCNELADKGDFLSVTKRINGGLNGYQDRLAYLEKARDVIA